MTLAVHAETRRRGEGKKQGSRRGAESAENEQPRHCERSEAIQSRCRTVLDCHAPFGRLQ